MVRLTQQHLRCKCRVQDVAAPCEEEDRSSRVSIGAGDVHACAFVELVSAAGDSELLGVCMDSNIVITKATWSPNSAWPMC
jgi:hypothetical protein